MKISELQAVKDNVIIKPIIENVTEGGIVIPDTVQNKDPQMMCEIISVGPEAAEEIKNAKIAICHPQAGLAMYVENTVIKVVKDGEIYAVFKGE